MAVFDPKSICRLCAKEKEFCVDIFGDDGVKQNVSKKIRLCLPITVREDEEYPKQICLSCLNKLDISYELYSECLSAEHTIKRLMRYCSRPAETPVVNNEIDRDVKVEQEEWTVPSESNPVVRYGNTLLTLVDKTSKRKSSDNAEEPEPKIRSTEYDECNDLDMKIDIDDSKPVGSPLQLPALGNEDYIGSGDDDDADDRGGGISDDDAANDGGECSQLRLPTENLTANTVEPSSGTCLARNISTTSSLQQLVTSKQVSEALKHDLLSAGRGRKSLETVQSAGNVGTQIESNSSEPNDVMSLLGSKFGLYYKFSSILESAVEAMIKEPHVPEILPEPFIPYDVYDTFINKKGNPTSSSSTPFIELEEPGAPPSHTRVPDNVERTHSSQQVHTPITVGQPVGIPTSQKRTLLGKRCTPSNVGNQIGSNSSASSVVATSSGQSSTVSEVETFSSSVDSALPVMVHIPGLDISGRPLEKSGAADRLYSEKRGLSGTPNTSITSSNPLLVPEQPEMSQAKLIPLPAAEPRNILAEPLAVQATNQQIYQYNRVQEHNSRDGSQEAVILGGQHSYFSGNPGRGQGVSSDTATASSVSLGTVTAAHASFKPQAVSMSPGASPAYPAGTAYVTDMQGPAVTGFGINSHVSPSKICTINSRPPSAVCVVNPLAASTETAAISNSNSTSSMHVTQSTTTNPVVTTSTSSPVSSVDVVETGTVQVTEGTEHECPHCHKKFPDNIIMHHVKLHYRRPFFSCISCDKNFRYEIGLEQHRCKGTAE